MARRIVTAREQYDMLAPWREAASSPWTDSEGRYTGPARVKAKPYRDSYSEDESGNCVSCGVHFSQPHQGPHTAAVDDSDASWDEHIRQRLKDQGGHTFRNHPSEDPPSSGFQVSQTPDNLHPADTFRGRDVRDFRDQNRKLLDSDPTTGVGIWQQPEGVYNEISKNHPGYWDAVNDAYKRDQISFHNNTNHDDVDTAETQYNGTPGYWMARRR